MADSEPTVLLAGIATMAAALYLYTAVRQLLRLEHKDESLPKMILIPGIAALLLHAVVIFDSATSLSSSDFTKSPRSYFGSWACSAYWVSPYDRSKPY